MSRSFAFHRRANRMRARQSTRTTGPTRLALARVAAVALTAVVMGACVDDGTTLCASGVRCPGDRVCTYDGDACREENSLCGNGVRDVAEGELCDDGNMQSGDGCRFDCKSTESCGDGTTEPEEPCDDGPLNGMSTSDCDDSCQRQCGNGVLMEFEDCDDTLFRVTCLDFGFDRGMLTCNNQCVPETWDCGYIGWAPEDRVTGTGDLRGLWGDTNGTVFAVGEDESGRTAILRYKGLKWGEDPSKPDFGPLHDVWGSGPDDVFAVGSAGKALHYDGSTWVERSEGLDPLVTLRGVWTAGADSDVIAVGDQGTIARYSRSARAWTRESLPLSVPEETVLEAVWGDGKSQLYAVGHARGRGVIVRYTGQRWELDAEELTTPELLDIWGSAEGDVFVVGEEGVILLRDPSSDRWAAMASNNTLALHSLWGSSADQVFAVGERGIVLFYDGEQWSTLESATDLTLTAVWGNPFLGIAAAAENGRVLRYHGWSWVAAPTRPEGGAIRSMWANGLSDVYVLTEDVIYPQRFDGRTWSLMSDGFAALDCLGTASSGGPSPLRHLWGRTDDDLYAVGDGNVILRYRPEQGWTCMTFDVPLSVDVHRILGTNDTFRSVFAVGEIVDDGGGIVLWHDGRSWREMIRTDAPLRGIWGETGNELFVVGDEGTILHYDAAAPGQWRQIPCEPSESVPCGRLNAIWGSSRSSIHVVGENGVTLRFDGQSWSTPLVISTEHLLDLWGTSEHVFAVGASGSLFHHERDTWAPVHSGTDQKLTSVWGLENPRVVMFGGEGGTFRRFVVSDDVPIVY
jgi:cysteine-rich repeat protein